MKNDDSDKTEETAYHVVSHNLNLNLEKCVIWAYQIPMARSETEDRLHDGKKPTPAP